MLVQVHEKNSLTLSDSFLFGSTFKMLEINLSEGNVHNVAIEVLSEKLIVYPKKSREPCHHGTFFPSIIAKVKPCSGALFYMFQREIVNSTSMDVC